MENADQILFASLRTLVTVIATDENSKNLDSHRLPQTFKDLKQWLRR